jgi:hypothetical protein
VRGRSQIEKLYRLSKADVERRAREAPDTDGLNPDGVSRAQA